MRIWSWERVNNLHRVAQDSEQLSPVGFFSVPYYLWPISYNLVIKELLRHLIGLSRNLPPLNILDIQGVCGDLLHNLRLLIWSTTNRKSLRLINKHRVLPGPCWRAHDRTEWKNNHKSNTLKPWSNISPAFIFFNVLIRTTLSKMMAGGIYVPWKYGPRKARSGKGYGWSMMVKV